MKIERLMTLSQFVDYITSHNGEEWTNKEAIKYAEECMETDLVVCAIPELISKYNNFLKQPLTKEMFVGNEIIFEGNWQGTANNMLGDDTYQISEGYNLIEFWKDGDINFMDSKSYEYWVKTLHELAESTKGKFKLKNIEL